MESRYWKTYSVNFTTGTRLHLEGPVPLGESLLRAAVIAAIITLVIMAPALLGAIRQIIAMVRLFAERRALKRPC
jgi:hypothetical protein